MNVRIVVKVGTIFAVSCFQTHAVHPACRLNSPIIRLVPILRRLQLRGVETLALSEEGCKNPQETRGLRTGF
jgi:hypothetical protein